MGERSRLICSVQTQSMVTLASRVALFIPRSGLSVSFSIFLLPSSEAKGMYAKPLTPTRDLLSETEKEKTTLQWRGELFTPCFYKES